MAVPWLHVRILALTIPGNANAFDFPTNFIVQRVALELEIVFVFSIQFQKALSICVSFLHFQTAGEFGHFIFFWFPEKIFAIQSVAKYLNN